MYSVNDAIYEPSGVLARSAPKKALPDKPNTTMVAVLKPRTPFLLTGSLQVYPHIAIRFLGQYHLFGFRPRVLLESSLDSRMYHS